MVCRCSYVGCVDCPNCRVSQVRSQQAPPLGFMLVSIYLIHHKRFRGAYTTALEGEPLGEVFENMDVIADDLVTMADKIIGAEAEKEVNT